MRRRFVERIHPFSWRARRAVTGMARRALLVVLVVLAAVWSADDGGRRTRLALPNGVQTDYVYAANDRLMSLVTTKGAATLASFAYIHDAVGNRTGITLANGETLAYTYDNAYRLTRELRKDSGQQTLFDQTFVYDAAGNRVSTVKNGITTTYVHNNANQLTTETTGNTVKTTTYDANGNQTLVETRVNDVLTVTEQTWYDQLSRRTQYTKTEGGTPVSESFTYRGAAWHRRTQTASGTTTTFLYDGDNVACDFISGSVDTFYVTPFLDENLSLTRSGTTYHYTHDGLGSVRTLTDSAGALANTYAYTAFGEPYAPGTTITLPQRYTFTGREENPVSPTMFYRWRTYAPSLGRFGARDPLAYDDGPCLYAYARNWPTRMVDPSGLEYYDFVPGFRCDNYNMVHVYSSKGGKWIRRDDYPKSWSKDRVMRHYEGQPSETGAFVGSLGQSAVDAATSTAQYAEDVAVGAYESLKRPEALGKGFRHVQDQHQKRFERVMIHQERLGATESDTARYCLVEYFGGWFGVKEALEGGYRIDATGREFSETESASKLLRGGGQCVLIVTVCVREYMKPRGPALPKEAWDKKGPRQVPPGVEKIEQMRYNARRGVWEKSTAHYDEYGRQIGRTDWTDHARGSDPLNPHTNPHHHTTTYGPGTAAGQETGPYPGPHPLDRPGR